MKSNPITAILLGVLFCIAILTLFLCYFSTKYSSEIRMLQMQAAGINNNRAFIQSLAADAAEYSKKNPAIDPVLESLGIKPRAGASTNKPAAK